MNFRNASIDGREMTLRINLDTFTMSAQRPLYPRSLPNGAPRRASKGANNRLMHCKKVDEKKPY
jgi:hypothetical protein